MRPTQRGNKYEKATSIQASNLYQYKNMKRK